MAFVHPAAENTSLMEKLVSHGNVVLPIQHVDQLNELQSLNRRQPPEKKRADAKLARQLQRAAAAEKASLAAEYYAASTNTNQIVIERSVDTAFVLDRAVDVLSVVPGLEGSRIDTSGFHLVGFSIGGAVSTEFAAGDSRVHSVVNMDGGMQGTMSGPSLMLLHDSSTNDREKR